MVRIMEDGADVKKTVRRWWWLWVAVLGPLLWLGFLAGSIHRFGMRDQAEAQAADCIIVLGAAVAEAEAKPSPVFEERIRHGIHLYQAGLAPVILFTGGVGQGKRYAESEVAAAYAVAAGVPAAAILQENRSRTTWENFAEAHRLMQARGLRSAIVVSDPYHLKRACWMAKDMGIRPYASPTPTTRYRSLRSKVPFLLRELYFWHHYGLTGR